MKEEILRLITVVREEAKKPGASVLLPSIIKCLESMAESVNDPQERREWLAAGLGRIVMESPALTESTLGQEIFRVLNKFANW